MSFPDVMIDLETLSTEKNAVIIAIGAVVFDPYGNDSFDKIEKDRMFYARLEFDSQINMHRDISESTIRWWLSQSPEAQAEFAPGKTLAFPETAIVSLNNFIKQHRCGYAWGNGATFDNVILQSLYQDYGIKWPVPYWGDMDLRTIKRFSEVDSLEWPDGVKHNALDDAKQQVILAQHYVRNLGVK